LERFVKFHRDQRAHKALLVVLKDQRVIEVFPVFLARKGLREKRVKRVIVVI
jgi:hypothetical protein